MACAFTFVHQWISLHQSPSLSLCPRHCFSRISPSSPASGGALSHRRTRAATGVCCRRYGRSSAAGEDTICFERAVSLFNSGEYYRCHDCLEELWYEAEEPIRTILHGIIQCAVGFHHLFNQNHRGAMMELGAGLCKLRKVGFAGGPFLRFEQEMSAALEFVYQTQKELCCLDPGSVSPFFRDELLAPVLHFVSVDRGERGLRGKRVGLYHERSKESFHGGQSLPARQEDSKFVRWLEFRQINSILHFIRTWFSPGADDFCIALDGSEGSYQLLGSFAAGQNLSTSRKGKRKGQLKKKKSIANEVKPERSPSIELIFRRENEEESGRRRSATIRKTTTFVTVGKISESGDSGNGATSKETRGGGDAG
ncbi:hypothetical protein AXF42_Ash013733 [Apostasia shenzhenica]|uniref:DUF309 domain-containing protein n=1 Tax=Apostasia shenzhenica TaxID=1088818 RepID=A0A2I0A4P4_9ASPA|nr:hypothetical protein AXF42_Ash013733 [Apostasia shenzhenica]